MSYISQTDIENVFGTSNVARWSNLENDTTSANATRITSAIAYAERYVENRFRSSRYAVPMVPLTGSHDAVLVDMMAKVAGVWLYSSRGLRDSDDDQDRNRVVRHRKEAEELIDLFCAGTRLLPYQAKESQQQTAPVVW